MSKSRHGCDSRPVGVIDSGRARIQRRILLPSLSIRHCCLRICLACAAFASFVITGAAQDAAESPGALLARMTLEEKIGQMVLLSGYGTTTGPMQEQSALETHIRTGDCGNVFNVLGVTQIKRLQRIAVEDTRLHIPLLFGYDTVHGYKTIFPICLGEAASWNLSLIEEEARVAATECSAAGLNWTFAPMVDVARDPRWGRISESAGEDPYLGSEVARARVRGYQGTNLAAADTVLACVKHYAAYGAPRAGRDYNTVDMSERMLREVYLPPYRAGIEAGAMSVMTSFNEVNGIPTTASRFLLQQILRDEWGFKGFVVTDYTGINELVAHGFAADEAEAGRLALEAGVDMDMQGSVYRKHLRTLLSEGSVTEAQINAAAKRILEAKFRLGLFDDPYRYCDEQRQERTLLAAAHRDTAYRMACQSFVLLKNEGQVLPLNAGATVAVIGPLAEARRDLLGSWKGRGEWEDIETVLDGIRRNNPTGKTAFASGCDIASTNRAGFREAVRVARLADVAVLVLGESWDMSGEARSRTSIRLPGVQRELLRKIKALGKPTILVLMNGRPLALEEEARVADALLVSWFPGTEGGRAVADVLFGSQNPAGKLPVTFPRNLGQVPIYYSIKNTGRPLDRTKPNEDYKSSYIDSPNEPLFPFGFGLSYTTFALSDVSLDRERIRPGEQCTATVTVVNTGTRSGAEVVQLYVRDLVGSVTRPLLELKGFQRVELAPGEGRTLRFRLGERDLAFLRQDLTWGTEPGRFEVLVGTSSRDLASARLQLVRDSSQVGQ